MPYTACRLGTAADRVEWRRRIRADRLERWRDVAREVGDGLKEAMAAVYGAKAEQLQSLGTPESRDADRKLREACAHFLALDFQMMDERAAELVDIVRRGALDLPDRRCDGNGYRHARASRGA